MYTFCVFYTHKAIYSRRSGDATERQTKHHFNHLLFEMQNENKMNIKHVFPYKSEKKQEKGRKWYIDGNYQTPKIFTHTHWSTCRIKVNSKGERTMERVSVRERESEKFSLKINRNAWFNVLDISNQVVHSGQLLNWLEILFSRNILYLYINFW